MSIIDKAAQVIADHNADGVCSEPECIAGDLARAGLLMPNLPEPDIAGPGRIRDWQPFAPSILGYTYTDDHDNVAVVVRGRVITLEPQKARDFALAILAAANLAERNQE